MEKPPMMVWELASNKPSRKSNSNLGGENLQNAHDVVLYL
jgi:hypothetical protein